jgi:hypothetical protein
VSAKVDALALKNRMELFGPEVGEYIFRLESKVSALESTPAPQGEYRYKTSEEAELLPLPLQILRLKEINAGLCNDHNTLVIMNARERESWKQAENKAFNAGIARVLDHLVEVNIIGVTLRDKAYRMWAKPVQEPAEPERGK